MEKVRNLGHRGEGSHRVNAVLGRFEIEEVKKTAQEKGITEAEALRRIVELKIKLRKLVAEEGELFLTREPRNSTEKPPVIPINFLL